MALQVVAFSGARGLDAGKLGECNSVAVARSATDAVLAKQ